MNIMSLITILRNAIKSNKSKIVVKASKKVKPFLETLTKENYIAGYKAVNSGQLAIFFNLTYKKHKILSLKHVSKPSKPVYFSYQDVCKFHRSLNTIILSTSHGVISHHIALKHICGGKVLCILF